MTREELTVAEKLDRYLLYGGQGMPVNESYFNQPMPRTSLRERRRRKGTPVFCFVCGDSHTMLYKTDNGYIRRTCRSACGEKNVRSFKGGVKKMSIPEKEFLSKKKYIYEAIFYPDGRLSIERRAIAYLNKEFVYAKVPGADELIVVRTRNIYDVDDVELVASNFFLALQHDHVFFKYYWDRPVVSEDRINEVRKRYLLDQIKDYQTKIDETKIDCEILCKSYEESIEKCKIKLEELEKK